MPAKPACPRALPPLERVLVVLDAQFVQGDVRGLLPLTYFATVASFSPTVDTQWPSAQDFLFPNLYFRFACLSNVAP